FQAAGRLEDDQGRGQRHEPIDQGGDAGGVVARLEGGAGAAGAVEAVLGDVEADEHGGGHGLLLGDRPGPSWCMRPGGRATVRAVSRSDGPRRPVLLSGVRAPGRGRSAAAGGSKGNIPGRGSCRAACDSGSAGASPSRRANERERIMGQLSDDRKLIHRASGDPGRTERLGPYQIEPLLLPAEAAAGTVYRVRIEPQQRTSISYHKVEEEYYFVLAGQGTA